MGILKINKHPDNIVSEYTRKQLMEEGAPQEFINKCIYIERLEMNHQDAEKFSVADFSVEDMSETYDRIQEDLEDPSRVDLIRICRSKANAEPGEISFQIRGNSGLEKDLKDIQSKYILKLAAQENINGNEHLFNKIGDLVTIEEEDLGNIEPILTDGMYRTEISEDEYENVVDSL